MGTADGAAFLKAVVAFPSEPAIPHVGMYPREMATEAFVHRSFVYNGPQVETAQMSSKRSLDIQGLVYS